MTGTGGGGVAASDLVAVAVQGADAGIRSALRAGSLAEATALAAALLNHIGGDAARALSAAGAGPSAAPGDGPPLGIVSPAALRCAVELLPEFAASGPAAHGLLARALLVALSASRVTRGAAADAAVLSPLLTAAASAVEQNAGAELPADSAAAMLLQAVELLGAHSAGPSELQAWLSAVAGCSTAPGRAALLDALGRAAVASLAAGPRACFSLDGAASGLLGANLARWPFAEGCTVATWLYIESAEEPPAAAATAAAVAAAATSSDAPPFSAKTAAAAAAAAAGESGHYLPRVYSVISGDGDGFEAFLHAGFLVVQVSDGRGKRAAAHFQHTFEPGRWYALALSHAPRGIGGSISGGGEVCLYVDGSLVQALPMEFPSVPRGAPLSFFCMGTNPPAQMAGLQRRRRQCALNGALGPVYVLRGAVPGRTLQRLAARGPDHLPCFGHHAPAAGSSQTPGLDALAMHDAVALDGELAASLVFVYHPLLIDGRTCEDASLPLHVPSTDAADSAAAASGHHARYASLLGATGRATRSRLTDAAWALSPGGPAILLQFLSLTGLEDLPGLQPARPPASPASFTLAAAVVRAIAALCAGHQPNQEAVYRAEGARLLAHGLRRCLQEAAPSSAADAPSAEACAVPRAALALARAVDRHELLSAQLIDALLLDTELWRPAGEPALLLLLTALPSLAHTHAAALRTARAGPRLLAALHRELGSVPALREAALFAVEMMLAEAEKSRRAGPGGAAAGGPAASDEALADDARALVTFLVQAPAEAPAVAVLRLMGRLVTHPSAARASAAIAALLHARVVPVLLATLRAAAAQAADADAGRSGRSGAAPISPAQLVESVRLLGLLVAGGHLAEDAGAPSAGGAQMGTAASLARTASSGTPPLAALEMAGAAECCAALLHALRAGGGQCLAEPLGRELYLAVLQASLGGSSGVQQPGAAELKLATAGLLGLPVGKEGGAQLRHAGLLGAVLQALPACPGTGLPLLVIDHVIALGRLDRANLAKLEAEPALPCWPDWLAAVMMRAKQRGAAELEASALSALAMLCQHAAHAVDGWRWVEWCLQGLDWTAKASGHLGDAGPAKAALVALALRAATGSLRATQSNSAGPSSPGTVDLSAAAMAATGSDGSALTLMTDAAPGASGHTSHHAASNLLAANAAGLLALAAGLSASRMGLKRTSLGPTSGMSSSFNASSAGGSRDDADAVAALDGEWEVVGALSVFESIDGSILRQQRARTAMARAVVSAGPSASGIGVASLEPVGLPGGLPRVDSAASRQLCAELQAAAQVGPEGENAAAAAALAGATTDAVALLLESCEDAPVLLMEGEPRLWLLLLRALLASSREGGSASGPEADAAPMRARALAARLLAPLLIASPGASVGARACAVGAVALLCGEVRTHVLGARAARRSSSGNVPQPASPKPGLLPSPGPAGSSPSSSERLDDLWQLLDGLLRRWRPQLPPDAMIEQLLQLLPPPDEEAGAASPAMRPGPVHTSSGMSLLSSGAGGLWQEELSAAAETALRVREGADDANAATVAAASMLASAAMAAAAFSKDAPARQSAAEEARALAAAMQRTYETWADGADWSAGRSAAAVDELTTADRARAKAEVTAQEEARRGSEAAWKRHMRRLAECALLLVPVGGAPLDSSERLGWKLDATESNARRRLRLKRDYKARQHRSADYPRHAPQEESMSSPAKPASPAASAKLLEKPAPLAAPALPAVPEIALSEPVPAELLAATTDSLRPSLGRSMTANYPSAPAGGTDGLRRPGQHGTGYRMASGGRGPGHVALAGMVGPAATMLSRTRSLILPASHGAGHADTAGVGSIGTLMVFDPTTGETKPVPLPAAVLDPGQAAGKQGRTDEDEREEAEGEKSLLQAAPPLGVEAAPTMSARQSMDMAEGGTPPPDASASPRVPELSAGAGVGNGSASAASDAQPPSPGATHSAHAGLTSDDQLLWEGLANLVLPLQTIPGQLQLTSRQIRFVPTELPTVFGASHVAPVAAMPAEDASTAAGGIAVSWLAELKIRAWPLAAVLQMQSRRHLLRRSALELFFADRSSALLDFDDRDARVAAYKALAGARPPNLQDLVAVTQQPATLLRRSGLTERWVQRKLSTFDYLMALNTLAGRSFNDLTQYPVFPWVLADYTSAELDLNNPASYRNLSKPMGALEPGRAARFRERYAGFDDPAIPKFHYGSHYSSAGTVLYFLLRLEPFASAAVAMQGGRFDVADRLFGDLAATWRCCLHDMSDVKELVPELYCLPDCLVNGAGFDLGHRQSGERVSDVVLPPWAKGSPHEFIRLHRAALESEYVSAHLHAWIDLIFGCKQRGAEAEAAQNVFFYLTYEGAVDLDAIAEPAVRQATRDQITYFGQTPAQLLTTPHPKRGPPEPAPAPIPSSPAKAAFFPTAAGLWRGLPAFLLRPVGSTGLVSVGAGPKAMAVAPHAWQLGSPDLARGLPVTLAPDLRESIAARMVRGVAAPLLSRLPFADLMGAAVAGVARVAGVSVGTDADGDGGSGGRLPRVIAARDRTVACEQTVVVAAGGRFLISGGHPDCAIKVWSVDRGRLLESAVGHSDVATCLALSAGGRLLASGARDGSLALWAVGEPARARGGVGGGASGQGGIGWEDEDALAVTLELRRVAHAPPAKAPPGSALTTATRGFWARARPFLEGPVACLHGHRGPVMCVAVCAELDLSASCSQRSGLWLHTLGKGRSVRSFPEARGHLVALGRHGHVVTWESAGPAGVSGVPAASCLRCVHVNGSTLAVQPLGPAETHLAALLFSADGEHVLAAANATAPVGSADATGWVPPKGGVVVLRRAGSLAHVQRWYVPGGAGIASACISPDNSCVLLSLADGAVLMLADPVAPRAERALSFGWE